ncbi:MAG: YbaB/EbfC family nucleoid-associated protein [Phycicoccus sp.]
MAQYTFEVSEAVKDLLGPELDPDAFLVRVQEQAARLTAVREHLEQQQYAGRSVDRLVTVTLGPYGGVLDVEIDVRAAHALATGRLGASVLEAVADGQAQLAAAHREELRQAHGDDTMFDRMFPHWPTPPPEPGTDDDEPSRPLGQLRVRR